VEKDSGNDGNAFAFDGASRSIVFERWMFALAWLLEWTHSRRMKRFLSLLILIAASTLQAQTIQTIVVPHGHLSLYQQDIPVLAGEVFEVVSWGGDGDAYLKTEGTQIQRGYFANNTVVKTVVAGPRTITLEVPADVGSVLTYKLSTNSTVATQNVASTVVVIPANASAPVDVILESSVDLITWTAALPGSYAPSTEKRFFRVRLVQH